MKDSVACDAESTYATAEGLQELRGRAGRDSCPHSSAVAAARLSREAYLCCASGVMLLGPRHHISVFAGCRGQRLDPGEG